MSMVYLANVPSIATDTGIDFYTPYEHVAVDYPHGRKAHYTVWTRVTDTIRLNVMETRDFAFAMDTAAQWLQISE